MEETMKAKDGTTLSVKEIRIIQIEQEYDEPLLSTLQAYALNNSFSFTCKLLGFDTKQLQEFKHLFKPNFRPEDAKKPAVGINNRARADKYDGKTLYQWATEKDLAYTTLRHRVKKLGWSIDKAVSTPPATRQQRGNAAHFNTERAKENREQIKQKWYPHD